MEECEDGVEEKDEETPVTESDSDEQDGAVTLCNQSNPRYYRTWWWFLYSVGLTGT